MRYVVTTGEKYTDIDGYACCIAYADLLRKEGKEAVALLPGVLNESVIPQVRAFPVSYETTYVPKEGDVFVMQDISEKSFFASYVELEKVVAVYDHHFGFEKEWKEKLGEKAVIEKIGACATFIVEEARTKHLLDRLESSCLKLLYTAIFANSLNLHAAVTTERDVAALDTLEPLCNFEGNWREEYFATMQQNILENPLASLKNDLKILQVNGEEWVIGQLELWDGKQCFTKYQAEFQKVLGENQQRFGFVTIPSISEGVTYIQPKNERTREMLEMYGLKENVLPTLRLRKEWIKLLMSSEM